MQVPFKGFLGFACSMKNSLFYAEPLTFSCTDLFLVDALVYWLSKMM